MGVGWNGKSKIYMTLYIADRSVLCMFIGYSSDHDGDVHFMWSLKMEHVYMTRYILWMKQMMLTKEVD
jgi:hypothetical protein